MKQIDYYKLLFEKNNKTEIFEINIDFFEDLIDTKSKIEELSKLPQVVVHRLDPSKQKLSEAAKQIIKLKQVYASQIVVLNKILGTESGVGEPGDAIANFKAKHGIANE